MEISEVKERIKKRGLKKSHIANQIGCSATELSHYLNNRRALRSDCLFRLEAYLK